MTTVNTFPSTTALKKGFLVREDYLHLEYLWHIIIMLTYKTEIKPIAASYSVLTESNKTPRECAQKHPCHQYTRIMKASILLYSTLISPSLWQSQQYTKAVYGIRIERLTST